jgi:urea transport system permease protein
LAFAEARAAILLFKEDATDAEKLEAIATIKARGDQEALALLTGLTGEQPPLVARAAAYARSIGRTPVDPSRARAMLLGRAAS